MKAIKKTEANFSNEVKIDLHKDVKLTIIVYLLCGISAVFFYILFYYVLKFLGLNDSSNTLFYIQTFKSMTKLDKFVFFTLMLITFLIHELIHGFFFYIFTGDKPKIGFKSLYLYAGAPNWYIRKNYFFIESLSPLIIITILGIVILSILPDKYSTILFLLFTVNAAGSFGDICVSLKLLNKPSNTYVNDTGIVFTINY